MTILLVAIILLIINKYIKMNHQDLQTSMLSDFTSLFKIIQDYDKRILESEKTIKELQDSLKNIKSNKETYNTIQLDNSDSESDSDSDSGSDSESNDKKYTEEILKKKKIPELKLICKEKSISSNRKNKQELIHLILDKS